MWCLMHSVMMTMRRARISVVYDMIYYIIYMKCSWWWCLYMMLVLMKCIDVDVMFIVMIICDVKYSVIMMKCEVLPCYCCIMFVMYWSDLWWPVTSVTILILCDADDHYDEISVHIILLDVFVSITVLKWYIIFLFKWCVMIVTMKFLLLICC